MVLQHAWRTSSGENMAKEAKNKNRENGQERRKTNVKYRMNSATDTNHWVFVVHESERNDIVVYHTQNKKPIIQTV